VFVLSSGVLVSGAHGQQGPTHISPDEASKHLISQATPFYPPMAEMARIQGDVILEIMIDESGAASMPRLIQGHPLLVQSAIDCAKRLRYRPFEINGKPTRVITELIITFGNPGAENRRATIEEMAFLQQFWSAERMAQEALNKGDYVPAQQQLKKASDLLTPVSGGRRHLRERWQWATTKGRLCMAEQKYDDAEESFKNALDLNPSSDKDSQEMAAALANLGGLYHDEKRDNLAHEYAERSVALYEKLFKKMRAQSPGVPQSLVQPIVYQSWMLANIAAQQHQVGDAIRSCHRVLDLQEFLKPDDRDSFVSFCKEAISNSEKN
jgi:TonB family protein